MTSTAAFWDGSIVPALVDYIRIPAKSPHFDRQWAKNGHIEAAVTLAATARATSAVMSVVLLPRVRNSRVCCAITGRRSSASCPRR